MFIKTLINEYSALNMYYIIIIVLTIISLFIYGKHRCDNNNYDILEFNLFKNSDKLGLDGWSITHFLIYIFMGFVFNKIFFLTIIGGILWELFETFIGIYKPNILSGYGFCENNNKYKIWWYGKFSDIFINILGLIVGNLCYKFYKL